MLLEFWCVALFSFVGLRHLFCHKPSFQIEHEEYDTQVKRGKNNDRKTKVNRKSVKRALIKKKKPNERFRHALISSK